MFTAIELFAGVAGFGLAIERSGGKVLVQVEKDKNCLSVLEKHFPNVERINDVKKANRTNLPDATLVCGGFPCTGMSVAGKRKGLDDEQSGLWWEFWRIIMELKPRYILIENVPGLFSSNGGRDFAILLAGLTGKLPEVPEKGWRNSGFGKGRSDAYHVAWRVLDSQFSGVPQRRRRVFIVGCLASSGINPAEILFESESLRWHPQKGRKKGKGTAATISANPPSRRNGGSYPTEDYFVVEDNLPSVSGTLAASGAGTSRNANELDLIIPTFTIRRSDEYVADSVASTLSARDYKSATDLVSIDLQQITSKVNRVQPSDESSPLTTHSETVVFNSVDVRNLELNVDVSGTLQAKEKGGSYSLNYQNPIAFAYKASPSQSMNPDDQVPALRTRHEYAVFGISPDTSSGEDIMPTLTQPSPNGGGHPSTLAGSMGIRRLTPLETERLQGFPDNYTEFGHDGKTMSDGTRYRMMGNAVSVPVVEWIIKRMIGVDKKYAK
jgi:DNA (cytosine-5)-methyltransferase 1